MLVKKLLTSMPPKVRVTTEEIERDLLMALFQIEVNLLNGKPTEIWYKYGAAPTNEQAQKLLTEWGPGSRANNGGLPF